ncbi:MAG: DUF2085 domain-containing protein [Mariniphaga sp.]|nr:DUF2085 domain-containing protein [Mariniphaga sp.]
MKKILEKVVTKIFVDSLYLHRFVGCHRLCDRSFFIQNRQFHVCARCTGLLTGIFISAPLLLFPVKNYIGYLFPIFLTVLVVDGLTQKFHLRESNNILRFFSGFITSFTFIPFLFIFVIKIYERI